MLGLNGQDIEDSSFLIAYFNCQRKKPKNPIFLGFKLCEVGAQVAPALKTGLKLVRFFNHAAPNTRAGSTGRL